MLFQCGKEPISRGNRWHTDCAVLASWVYYEGARLTSQSADFLNLFCFFSCGVKVSYDEPTNTITDTIDCDLVKTRPTKNPCVIVLKEKVCDTRAAWEATLRFSPLGQVRCPYC
jgi:hypothetical protein